MSVSIDLGSVTVNGEQVANFTIVLTRGGDYINQWVFRDSSGNPVNLLSAEIEVVPRGALPLVWNEANGMFTFVSTGTYLLNLTGAYVDSLQWSAGPYHVNIVEDSGFSVPCIISGLVFVEEC